MSVPVEVDTELTPPSIVSGGCPERAGNGTPNWASDATLGDLLAAAVRAQASDLLLVADAPPTVYVKGAWVPASEVVLTPESISKYVGPILSEAQRARLQRERDLDFGMSLPGVGRFRANLHFQSGSLAAAFRIIPTRVPRFADLGLPDQILPLADLPSGLVLIAGGTGQGKSTTLAALIDHINHTRAAHIITIEDPIEFGFQHGRCVIEQREIGEDSPSFAAALRHVLRQRPDVILIGEMRDHETISTALTAAETGHLILASLHTSDASQSLSRIIDVFPASQQAQIRTQLAGSLRAILCQTLVCDLTDQSLTPATELLIANAAIRRAIRENEGHLIYGMLETGRAAGMHTLEQSLAELVRQGRTSPEDALSACAEPARLKRLIGERISADQDSVEACRQIEILSRSTVE